MPGKSFYIVTRDSQLLGEYLASTLEDIMNMSYRRAGDTITEVVGDGSGVKVRHYVATERPVTNLYAKPVE